MQELLDYFKDMPDWGKGLIGLAAVVAAVSTIIKFLWPVVAGVGKHAGRVGGTGLRRRRKLVERARDIPRRSQEIIRPWVEARADPAIATHPAVATRRLSWREPSSSLISCPRGRMPLYQPIARCRANVNRSGPQPAQA